MIRSWTMAVCAFAATIAGAPGALAKPSDEARAKDAFAECIVRRQPKFAAAWLALLPGSPEEQARIAASGKDFYGCLGKAGVVVDDVTTTRSSLRGAVAARLVESRLASMPGSLPVPEGSLPWFTEMLMAAPDGAMDRAELRTEFFAHCVALKQWPETLAALGEVKGGPAEMPAVMRLKPALASCLETGTTVSFRPDTLRPMLANAVYHIALSAPPSGPSASPPRPAPAVPATPPPPPRLRYGTEGL